MDEARARQLQEYDDLIDETRRKQRLRLAELSRQQQEAELKQQRAQKALDEAIEHVRMVQAEYQEELRRGEEKIEQLASDLERKLQFEAPAKPSHPSPPPAVVPEVQDKPPLPMRRPSSMASSSFNSPPPPPEINNATRPVPPPPPRRPVSTSSPTDRSPSLVSAPTASAPPKPKPKPGPQGLQPVKDCISSFVNFQTDWFNHSSASDFDVCSRCYVDHIYSTPFRDAFTRKAVQHDPSMSRRCDFGPCFRLVAQLWPAAVASGSLNQVVEFMQQRQRVPPCSGARGLKDQFWYQAADIPGATFCEACYQDYLLAAPFASNFRAAHISTECNCDMSLRFVQRRFKQTYTTNDWKQFSEDAKSRVSIPPCPGQQALAANERKWFCPKAGPGKDTITFCFACYADSSIGTPNEEHYKPMQLDKKAKVNCDTSRIDLAVVLAHSCETEDWGLIWTALEKLSRVPFCHPKGIKGAKTWYTLAGCQPPIDGFNVCEACYATIVESTQGSRYFTRRNDVNPGDLRLCCFNKAHVRSGSFLQFFSQTLTTGDARAFIDHARDFSDVPSCPRSDPNQGMNRRWWGWNDCCICHECYLTFAKGTTLCSRFSLSPSSNSGVQIPQSRLCSLYSRRMRELYTQTCQTGDVSSFLTAADERLKVYLETVPRLRSLREMQQISLQQSQMYNNMSLAYSSMASTAATSASVGYGGYGYGYGYGVPLTGPGVHALGMAASGAAYGTQGVQAGAQATDPKVMMEIRELAARWARVE